MHPTTTSPHVPLGAGGALPILLSAVLALGLALGLTGPATAAADPALDRGPSDCRSVSTDLPWGRLPLRRWTPRTGADAPAGGPFRARLVRAHGRDTAHAPAMVLLESADGCRRAYQRRVLADDDQAYVRRVTARHPAAPDTRPEPTVWRDERFVPDGAVESGEVRRTTSRYFTFWYGTDTDAFSYRWVADRGERWDRVLATAARWGDESYALIRDVLDAPMPYDDAPERRKLNVYVCGTGMTFPDHDDQGDCGASAGAQSMFVSVTYLQDGSTTFVHELAHVLQDFSGGFRGPESTGAIWEGHANWVDASLTPGFNIWYWQNLENGPTWWTSRYGMFPLLLQLSSRPGTRDLVWRAWFENDRAVNGDTTEDFLETVVRLGREDGVYPRSWASFADETGWYGARLAARDFEQRQVFTKTMGWHQEASRYVGLRPTGTARTWASSTERPLWQYGTHVVPLDVDGSAKELRLSLRGLTERAGAGWRYALVRVPRDGTDTGLRYSGLGAAGGLERGRTVRLDVRDDADHFLAVTATPTTYARLEGDDPRPAPTTFPYRVRVDGASPSLPGSGSCLGPYTGPDAANLNWHTNGNVTYDQAC